MATGVGGLSEEEFRAQQAEAAKAFPFLFHAAEAARWEACKASGSIYYPPTFEQDGSFVHATGDPSKLLEVEPSLVIIYLRSSSSFNAIHMYLTHSRS